MRCKAIYDAILGLLKPTAKPEPGKVDFAAKACPNCRHVGAWSKPAVFVQLDRRRVVEQHQCGVCGLQLIGWRTATRAEIKAQKKLEKKRR